MGYPTNLNWCRISAKKQYVSFEVNGTWHWRWWGGCCGWDWKLIQSASVVEHGGEFESVAAGGFRLWLEWLEGYMLVLESSDRKCSMPPFFFPLFFSAFYVIRWGTSSVFVDVAMAVIMVNRIGPGAFLTLNMYFFMDLLQEQRDDVF